MCRILKVSRQVYYKWLTTKDKPYKHADLLVKIKEIRAQDSENENYGIVRIFQALNLEGFTQSQSTVARVMRENRLIQAKKRKPNSLTKSEKQARKSEDLLKRNFTAENPNQKWVTDITEVACKDGKLYVSGIFDCFDNCCVGLTMGTNMKKQLVIETLKQAFYMHKPQDVILHSDRGSQYTSGDFRDVLRKFGVTQSMNSASGKCHDNAKCESMWARFKEEKIYKMKANQVKIDDMKQIVFKFFMGYWNNRRVCSANGGFPPVFKRNLFFSQLDLKVA